MHNETITKQQKKGALATQALNEMRTELLLVNFNESDFCTSENLLDHLDFALLAISRFMTELADLKE